MIHTVCQSVSKDKIYLSLLKIGALNDYLLFLMKYVAC